MDIEELRSLRLEAEKSISDSIKDAIVKFNNKTCMIPSSLTIDIKYAKHIGAQEVYPIIKVEFRVEI
jgi:hypothetical protein